MATEANDAYLALSLISRSWSVAMVEFALPSSALTASSSSWSSDSSLSEAGVCWHRWHWAPPRAAWRGSGDPEPDENPLDRQSLSLSLDAECCDEADDESLLASIRRPLRRSGSRPWPDWPLARPGSRPSELMSSDVRTLARLPSRTKNAREHDIVWVQSSRNSRDSRERFTHARKQCSYHPQRGTLSLNAWMN